MLPFVFSTELFPIGDQFDQWRGWKHPLLDVTADDSGRHGFAASLRAWKIGEGLLLTEMDAPAATTVRSPRLLRNTPDDHWVISSLISGIMTIQTATGTLAVAAGESHVWSLGQPSVSTRSRVHRLDLYLSRDTFRDIAPVLDAVTGLAMDGPLEQALGKFLMKLTARLPEIPTHDTAYLVDAIRKLVASALAPMARQRDTARKPASAGPLERVRQAVRANLQSPGLNGPMLCRSVGMSRSSLYRMLEGAGGVASYIQRHRLMEARQRLADSRNTQPIEAIARDLCFTDASTFSRAFRAAFRISPSEARSGSAKPGLAEHPRVAAMRPATSFVDLLRP